MSFSVPDMNELAATRQGDPLARQRLAERVLPTVVQWCARLGGPKVDAEDAAHDVMIVLLTRLPQLEVPERFPAWLYGVTRRVLAQHRRRAWVRRWLPGVEFGERPDPKAGPDRNAESNETSARVQQALEDLSDSHREILVLADVEERTETEIADLLQLPLGTVRSRTRRARETFLGVAPRHGLRPSHLHVVDAGS